jgi:hypothetical protein
MRSLILGSVGLGVLLLLAGCNWLNKMGINHQQSSESVQTFNGTPTTAQLVSYLNQNSARLSTIQCAELELDCQRKLESFALRGRMTCEKPRNFRMVADVLGSRQVDMGSNQQEFWWWIARGDNAVIHCSYDDLKRGVAMPFPFQPEWMMEALGMAEYGPAENYQMRSNRGTWELIQETVNPQQQRVYKVTVLTKSPVRVQAYVLFDANKQIVCKASIPDAQTINGVTLPRRIVLEWPAEKITLKMKLDEVTLNQPIPQDLAASLFARPRIPNVPDYDLARRNYDSTTGDIRRAGGMNADR